MTEPAEMLNDRLILVTGKGGTGKTTMAAAIAMLQAGRGRRTLLAEVDAQRGALAPVFGIEEPGLEPVRVGENLEVCNLLWPDVLGAYLESMIRIRRLVNAILGNEMVRRFLDFTPGSQEVVLLSVLGDLVDRYDVVVVDMPASGHAFSMLDITRSALGLFRTGPIRRRMLELRQLLHDPRTRVVLVALPEEMVVNETLETLGRLKTGDLLGATPLIVLNRAITPTFSDEERSLLTQASAALRVAAAGAELLAAGRWELSLEMAVQSALARLAGSQGQAPIIVPPVGVGGVASQVARAVSRHLAGQLGLSEEDTWT